VRGRLPLGVASVLAIYAHMINSFENPTIITSESSRSPGGGPPQQAASPGSRTSAMGAKLPSYR